MLVCAQCCKPIRGRYIVLSPPTFEIALGISKVAHYHPRCFKRAHPDMTVEA